MRTVFGSGTTPGEWTACERRWWNQVWVGGGDGDREPAGRWMVTVGLGWQRLKRIDESFCGVAGL